MTLIDSTRSTRWLGTLVGGTLIGVLLVAAGALAAYLAIATPLVSRLMPDAPPGGRQVALGLGIWSFSLIAGGALLVAGTHRLAIILTTLRTPRRLCGPAVRAVAHMSDEVVVAGGVVPNAGPPIPELLIGPFGVAVVHELLPSAQVRLGSAGWESRTNDGWMPTDDPLDQAVRDAERVRRWLAAADLDFVVRVYAALVVADETLRRTPACAVIVAEQIPAWIASLPRQRTLTAGRRGRLLALTRSSREPGQSGHQTDRGW